METCINYCEPGWAYVSSDERRWINRIRNLAEEKPGECVVMNLPDENGGFIYAKVPQSWVRIRPSVKRELTEEQREALAERVKVAQAARAAKKNVD